jgi:hypothetical protein
VENCPSELDVEAADHENECYGLRSNHYWRHDVEVPKGLEERIGAHAALYHQCSGAKLCRNLDSVVQIRGREKEERRVQKTYRVTATSVWRKAGESVSSLRNLKD